MAFWKKTYVPPVERKIEPRISDNDIIEDLAEKVQEINDPSVKYYTTNNFKKIAHYLRGHKNLEEEAALKQHVENIDRVFKMLEPIKEPIVVYRGIKPKYKDSLTDQFMSYMSTTFSLKTLHESGFYDTKQKCCILHITVPVGAKILPVYKISDHFSEDEVLLERGGKLIMTAKELIDGIMTYYCTFIPMDNRVIQL